MSLNVGNISARFGLDPAEFLEKLRGVSGATKFFSDEMRRDMRQTSRDGAEAFRTLDEMMGIHLNRPMTRLLVETFPSFAKGLQSILGGVAFGAVAFAVTALYDKIEKGIEKAQKAQEAWQEAIRKTQSTVESVGDSYARKIAEAKGMDPLMKHVMAGADEAKAAFEKVSTAIVEQNKKAEEAAGIWNRLMLLVAQTGHEMFTSAGSLGAEQMRGQLATLKIEIEEAFRLDALHGTHNAMAVFQRDLQMATQQVNELTAAQAKQSAMQSLNPLSLLGSLWSKGDSKAQLAAAQQWVDLLKQAIAIDKDRGKLEGAQTGADSLKDRITFYRELNAEAARFAPDANPLHKLQGEITAAKEKAVLDFEQMRKAGAKALTLDHALVALDRWEHRLDEVAAKAKASADVDVAAAKLPTTIAATGQAPAVGARTAMPTLGVGGLAGAQIDAFAKDQGAQLKLAAQAYEQALTPLGKYKVGQQELALLVQKGLIDQQAYTAAMAQLDQQLVKAASSAHKMQEELQKLLERSNDAGAGLKAWAIQLQINAAENGRFIFDVLTSATKNAEGDAAKSLMMILEEQRGGHRKLIHDLSAMWSSYFKNLAEMGIKHGFDKLLGPVGKAITGGQKPGAGAAGLSSAGAMLTHAGAELLSAAMALKASTSMSGAGGASAGSGPIGDLAGLGGAIPFFASGGDATPGSSFISGEAGAEEVSLDGRGGAHITPLGVTAGGGDTYVHNDFSNTVMTEDLMRRAEGLQAIRHSEARMMSAIPAMQREIGLRKRS